MTPRSEPDSTVAEAHLLSTEVAARARPIPGSGTHPAPARHRCGTCGDLFPAEYKVCPRDATPLGVVNQAHDPLIGVVLAGTYRITRTIGRGGMGRLYEAEHARIRRAFAIKVLHEVHAEKADTVRRFEREAAALARIRSDHVLDVVDVLMTPDGRTAIVTTLLEGEDLQKRLERTGRMPASEAIAVARQLCRGLSAAHAVGVIHRDLKPSNLFLAAAPDGRLALKILDFGVAKLSFDDDMTRTGVVLGTPAYMAPEQARGSREVDVRSDVYSVGAVLYRMLTGAMPYEGGDPAATLVQLLSAPPTRPRARVTDIPEALELLVQRAMARRPEDRPSTVLELEDQLEALAGTPDCAPREGAAPLALNVRDAPDTVVLARGAVERAAGLEQDARRARPRAAIAAAGAVLLSGASTSGLLSSAASALVGTDEAPRALGQALAIVGGFGAAVVVGVLVSRALLARWASAAEVESATRRLASALLWALAAFGATIVAGLAASGVRGESWELEPVEAAVRLAFGGAVACSVTLHGMTRGRGVFALFRRVTP